MKGAATTMESILIIIIIIFYLVLLITLVQRATQKDIIINTETLELSKLSNTFYLVNRSLYTTWYVSTVQTLFTAGFDGFGCEYWYQADPGRAFVNEKNIRFPITFSKTAAGFRIETYDANAQTVYSRFTCEINGNIFETGCVQASGIKKFELDVPSGKVSSCRIDKYSDASCSTVVIQGTPTALNAQLDEFSYMNPERKYSKENPRICAPDRLIADYFLNKTFDSYKNIRRDVQANGLNIHAGSKDADKMAENKDIVADFTTGDDRVENRVSHEISLSAAASKIETKLNYNISIETNLSDMMEKSRDTAGFLLLLHDKMTNEAELRTPDGKLAYKDQAFDERLLYKFADEPSGAGGENRDAYISRLKLVLKEIEKLKEIGNGLSNLDISVKINKLELIGAPNNILFAPEKKSSDGTTLPDGSQGLALHYDVDIIFSDKAEKTTRTVEEGFERGAEGIFGWLWPTASRLVTSCFGVERNSETGTRPHKGMDIGSATEGDDIFASGKSGETIRVARVERNCPLRTRDDTDIVKTEKAKCGGRYGNFVELEHKKDDKVLYHSFYAHLNSVDENINEGNIFEFDETNRKKIGVMGNTGNSRGTHLHFEVRKDGQKLNPCDFINCGESGLRTCSVARQPEKQDLIEDVILNGYYFYDEGENSFEKLPMQLHIQAEDYLPALDCTMPVEIKGPDKIIGKSRPYIWEKPVDIICLDGKLYTCGAANSIKGMWYRGIMTEGTAVSTQLLTAICEGGAFRFPRAEPQKPQE